MIDVEQLIAESFVRLYPAPAVTPDWNDVLRRAGRQRGVRFDRFLPRSSLRLRLALILLVGLLLLAGIATATYLGVRTWVSAGPRGVQYQSDYRLATVFAAKGNPVGWSPGGNPVPWWTSFALAPGGHDLYAMTLPVGARAPVLVRIAGVDRGTRLRATKVLDLRRLHVPNWCVWPFVRPVTVAANGDVFFVAGGADRPPTGMGCAAPGAMNDTQLVRRVPADRGGLGHLLLFVLHPDGSRQLILSGSTVVRSMLFPPDWMEWEIAASAPDRIWIAVGPLDGGGPHRLLEVVDPNGDGDWSDRIVRRLELPASLASDRSFRSWQLAAEPSLSGDGRSSSVLAAVSDGRGFRVYRISDRNPGEVRLLLERPGNVWAQVAPRVITKNGVAHRELVVGGLSRPDRVSLVSAAGRVLDVARAFRGLSTVFAGPDGVLYAITGTWEVDRSTNSLVVYRLEPASAGRGSISVGSPLAQAAPAVSFPPSRTAGAPRLQFTAGNAAGTILGSYTIAADGRGLHRLVSHIRSACQSVDGRALAYSSDAEVPTEFFTYVARPGARPVKVTERDDRLVCPFGRRWLLLYRPVRYRADGSSIGSLIRHDVRTGREALIARGVDRYALSPDGTKLVYVGRRGSGETLVAVDLATLEQRTIAGPEPRTLYSFGGLTSPSGFFGAADQAGLRWSPDGARIAYFTGLRPHGAIWSPGLHGFEHDLRIQDVATGATMLRLRIPGGPPSISWSADGTRLLVCASDRVQEANCGAEPGRLLLVDVRTGSVHGVARGRLNLVGWAPSGTTFAYATPEALIVVSGDGRIRRLPTGKPPGPCGIECRWLGWSPDGRYIGLDAGWSEKWPRGIELVNVRTGRRRVLRPLAGYYGGMSWWRR